VTKGALESLPHALEPVLVERHRGRQKVGEGGPHRQANIGYPIHHIFNKSFNLVRESEADRVLMGAHLIASILHYEGICYHMDTHVWSMQPYGSTPEGTDVTGLIRLMYGARTPDLPRDP